MTKIQTDYTKIETISPHDGSIVVTKVCETDAQVAVIINDANEAFKLWKYVSLKDRISIIERSVTELRKHKEEIGKEITKQMGRPIRYSSNELNGYGERCAYMCSVAEEALKTTEVLDKVPDFYRCIKKEPLGVVVVIAAWNYPYLTAVNTVIPAILAGNSVVLKHSPQTMLVADRIKQSLLDAGLPPNVMQAVNIVKEESINNMIQNPLVKYVAFTGSVLNGRKVTKTAADCCETKFMNVGLELGGKDPAYVRFDCDLENAVETIVDGAMFNSGQCCCGIERVYVHEQVYDAFIEKAVALTKTYKLGNPMNPETTLGPLISLKAADFVRKQIKEAVAQGAIALVDESLFPESKQGTCYLAPQILVNVDHNMRVMREETFGPVMGVMKVNSDKKAIELMNDSNFGLTACVWTQDEKAGLQIGEQIETGTFFINRCDYLDPALCWTGIKDSGRGCTLSKFGFDALTRPKSFHSKRLK